MSKTIEIIAPGSEVLLADGAIPAKVVEVLISEQNHVQYKCAWWSVNTRYCEWLSAFEVEADSDAKTAKIGFTQ